MLDRELTKILVRLGDDKVVGKTVPMLYTVKDDSTGDDTFMNSSDLILRNPQYGLDIANMLASIPPAQQIYLATMLSVADKGWTPELQEKYFKWYHQAFGFKGGNSYIGFIDKARKLALGHVAKDQLAHFSAISGDSLVNQKGTSLAFKGEAPKGPGKNWTLEEALKAMETLQGNRNFKSGANLYAAVRCESCHTMKGNGSSMGPDLSQLGSRFTPKDILESIIEPNKVISDQYESKVFMMKDGTSVLGRLKDQNDTHYIISQNPYAPLVTKELLKKDVLSTKVSEISIMPPGTINVLNEEELKDLMAYLISGANENSDLYKKK